MKNNSLERDWVFDARPTGADKARRLADVSVLTWQRHDAALSPIIGKGGFAALFRHCVSVRQQANPWLGEAYQGVAGTGDFTALRVALEHCSGPQGAVTQGALMKCFHELLVALIGKPLLRKVLRSSTDVSR